MAPKNESRFCILCGKQRTDPLTNVPLWVFGEGSEVRAEVCRCCQVVLHNLGRLYDEGVKRKREEDQRKAQQIIKVVDR